MAAVGATLAGAARIGNASTLISGHRLHRLPRNESCGCGQDPYRMSNNKKTILRRRQCQIKKIATHNIPMHRSPARSRSLETSRSSQCSRTRADSPRVRSRNRKDTIKRRKNRLRRQGGGSIGIEPSSRQTSKWVLASKPLTAGQNASVQKRVCYMQRYGGSYANDSRSLRAS